MYYIKHKIQANNTQLGLCVYTTTHRTHTHTNHSEMKKIPEGKVPKRVLKSVARFKLR